jgi:CRP/FNR family cyclic AMP-dependent transcriptional regulator
MRQGGRSRQNADAGTVQLMSFGPGSSRRLIRVLEADPDLGQALDGPELAEATRQAVGTLEVAEPGPWRPRGVHDGKLLFGGLICDGLLVRELALGSSVSAEMLGAGDVLVPYDADQAVPFVPSEMGWTVLETVRIAWLDAPFAVATRRWPQLGVALLQRAQRRADRLAVTQAIAQITRVDDRVLALLWHLSERWGRVTPAGVILPFKLTHKAIARLVGAQRPSVTTALTALEKGGLVARREDGAWVLGTPQQPADADAPADVSPWRAGRSASLLPERPVPMPLDVRLSQLSETFARTSDQMRVVLDASRALREESIELRDQARQARRADSGR